MTTRAQEWSRRAFLAVRKQQGRDGADKYRTACMKMPGLVHQSGLLQALVFELARDAQGQQFVDDLASTLLQSDEVDHRVLIEEAQKAHLARYLALTRDVVEVAQWFRRFAQIELDEDAPRAS
ncbi:MAG: type III-B CRISPR module-associated protein Cmr5 [Alphaproteobacteria bacterium]|nr:type III-B CRISPR module-associated protein Cmr5 [Alphaproteobacteria bacterium]